MTDRGPWFVSLKGNRIFPLDLRPEEIDPEEIACALSKICRFGGQLESFYSVGQHSVLVAQEVPRHLAFVGLLHDATEAYRGDMVRPLKRALPEFQAIEDKIWLAITERFRLPYLLPPQVKEANTRMLMTEKRDLLIPAEWPWAEDQVALSLPPYDDLEIRSWDHTGARRAWMQLFWELGGR